MSFCSFFMLSLHDHHCWALYPLMFATSTQHLIFSSFCHVCLCHTWSSLLCPLFPLFLVFLMLDPLTLLLFLVFVSHFVLTVLPLPAAKYLTSVCHPSCLLSLQGCRRFCQFSFFSLDGILSVPISPSWSKQGLVKVIFELTKTLYIVITRRIVTTLAWKH